MGDSGRELSALFTWRSAVVESELASSRRLVALVLSLHMSERGDSCFPAVRTIAAETGLSTSTVGPAIEELVEAGFLTVERGNRGRGGRGKVNRYRATFPETRPPSSETTDGDDPGDDAKRRDGRDVPGGKRRDGRTDPDVNVAPTATEGVMIEDVMPPDPDERDPRAEAEQIVREWWEERDRAPTCSFVGVVKWVETAIVQGSDPDDLRYGLRTALVPTAASVEVAIARRDRAGGGDPGPSSSEERLGTRAMSAVPAEDAVTLDELLDAAREGT